MAREATMRWTLEQYRRYLETGIEPGVEPAAKPAKRPKYGNDRTPEGDSKKERTRYQELELLEKAGEIKNLRKQVPYALVVNGILVASYRADFVYEEGTRVVVEDAKGYKTPMYRLKKKLMQACYGIDIRET